MPRAAAVILRRGSFLGVKFRSALKGEAKRARSEMNFKKPKLDPDRTAKHTERLRTTGLPLLAAMRKSLSGDALKRREITSPLFTPNKTFTQKKAAPARPEASASRGQDALPGESRARNLSLAAKRLW